MRGKEKGAGEENGRTGNLRLRPQCGTDFSTNRTFPYFHNIPILHNFGGLGELEEMW